MKTKCFSDEDLMKFADGDLPDDIGKAMDILRVLLEDTHESKDLRRRLEVFTKTRNALINVLIGEKK